MAEPFEVDPTKFKLIRLIEDNYDATWEFKSES